MSGMTMASHLCCVAPALMLLGAGTVKLGLWATVTAAMAAKITTCAALSNRSPPSPPRSSRAVASGRAIGTERVAWPAAESN